jgi:branched-chain amino acid transport system substrate-binding protein
LHYHYYQDLAQLYTFISGGYIFKGMKMKRNLLKIVILMFFMTACFTFTLKGRPSVTPTLLPTVALTQILPTPVSPTLILPPARVGLYTNSKYYFSLIHPLKWKVDEQENGVLISDISGEIFFMANSSQYSADTQTTLDQFLDDTVSSYRALEAKVFTTSTLLERSDYTMGDGSKARLQVVKGKHPAGLNLTMYFLAAQSSARRYAFMLYGYENSLENNYDLVSGLYDSIQLTDTPVELSYVKIAVLAPLSGKVPTYGASMREGALLALKEWNAKGGVLGKKIKVVVEDSQCAAGPATDAANRVIDEDGVHYIIGEVCSGASIPVSEIANARHVLQISGTSMSPLVVVDANGRVKPYTFVACYNEDAEARAMASFAYTNLKAKKAFIIYNPQDSYLSSLTTGFEKYYTAAGGAVAGKAAYASTDTDFSTMLAEVAKAGPDVVILPGYYNVTNLVLKQAREKDISTPFLGDDGWDSSGMDMQAADGSYFTIPFSPTENRPVVQNFVKSYSETYNDEKGNPKVPDVQAALAYDSTNLMLSAIQQTGVDDPVKVKDALERISYEGVSGKITFDATHKPIKPVMVLTIKGGKVQFEAQVMP